MTNINIHDDLINEICRCAFLVAYADGGLSDEEESGLGEARGQCRQFIEAREATEYLEETNDIEQARTMFDSEMPLVHDVSCMFTTYLNETQDAISTLNDFDGYLELVDTQAAKVTDRYFQFVTVFIAELVASADGSLSPSEREIRDRLFTSWEVTREDYEYWYAKYAAAIVFGSPFNETIKIEDFDNVKDEPEVDISALLSEVFGVDSIEELTELLKDHEPEQEDTSSLPDIYQAILEGDTKLLLESLEAGADPNQKIEISGIEGLTPLMIVAERANLEMVTVLTEYGANINDVTDERGYTPLVWAIKGKNEDIAEFLIENGANVEPFADREADYSPLSMAAFHHLVGIAKTLLAKGANPNWRDPKGNVPLKQASGAANSDDAIELIKLLLENKADPNLHDDEGFYPIHSAIDHHNVRVTELFLQNGVPIDLCFPEDADEFGSLLKRACIRADPDIINLILKLLPDEKFVESKVPPFVEHDDDGNPTVGDDDGFELVATVLMHGYTKELDLSDIERSVELLCEKGVKPDLIGLCFSFFYPEISKKIIPFCKPESDLFLQEQPEFLIGFTFGLLASFDNDIQYFFDELELWTNAVECMKACGVDVPASLELDEE